MRVMQWVALAACAVAIVAGCGSGSTSRADATSRRASETAGVHDVDMVFDGSAYRFVPQDVTIRPGDAVRFHNKSGGPHNVSFWPDSIPTGAAAVLEEAMPNQMSPLVGEMIITPDEIYEISFTGAPLGIYKYYCLPHLQLGMVGGITVGS